MIFDNESKKDEKLLFSDEYLMSTEYWVLKCVEKISSVYFRYIKYINSGRFVILFG